MPIIKDPVCGQDVDTDAVNATVTTVQAGAPETDPAAGTKRFHNGSWYYFHNLECRLKFLADPGAYIDE